MATWICEDKELFERALKEPKIIVGKIPKASNDFVPDEEEVSFQIKLQSESLMKYFNYIMIMLCLNLNSFGAINMSWNI